MVATDVLSIVGIELVHTIPGEIVNSKGRKDNSEVVLFEDDEPWEGWLESTVG